MNAKGKALMIALAGLAALVTAWLALDDGEPVQRDDAQVEGSPAAVVPVHRIDAPAARDTGTYHATNPPRPAAGSGHKAFRSRAGSKPAAQVAATAATEPASVKSRRAALADPSNPVLWVELARDSDAEGKHDIAIAALRRALALGGDFEGRHLVERIVKDYEEAVRLGRTAAVPLHILDDNGYFRTAPAAEGR